MRAESAIKQQRRTHSDGSALSSLFFRRVCGARVLPSTFTHLGDDFHFLVKDVDFVDDRAVIDVLLYEPHRRRRSGDGGSSSVDDG